MVYVAMVRPGGPTCTLFGHVNNASMVTLLEEARVPLLFGQPGQAGLTGFAKGMVVTRLAVDYRAPVVAAGTDIRVEVVLRRQKFASVTLGYAVHNGPSAADERAVTAETVLAPYDTRTGRPRRLTNPERVFLRETLDPV